jgi:hypothetical protein
MDDILRNTEGFDAKRLPGWNTTKYLKDRINDVGYDRVRIDV